MWKQHRRWNLLFRKLAPFVLGAALSVGVAVLADSVYFGSLRIAIDGHALDESPTMFLTTLASPLKWSKITWQGTLTLTPLNNLLYNINVDNVKQHGLHPRYLHLLVNFPLLFGPLAIAVVYKMKGAIARAWEDHRHGHLTFGKQYVCHIACSDLKPTSAARQHRHLHAGSLLDTPSRIPLPVAHAHSISLAL